jgi:hypothetical protein
MLAFYFETAGIRGIAQLTLKYPLTSSPKFIFPIVFNLIHTSLKTSTSFK